MALAVVKRGKVWQVQVRIGKDAQGKWIRQSATCDTKAEAEAMERRMLVAAEANRAKFIEPTDDTVRMFLSAWMDRRRPRLRPGTIALYDDLLRLHIYPGLGDVRLDALSPRKVQAWLDQMGPSKRTEDARNLLRIALEDALRRGVVLTNVATRTDAPHRQKPKRASFTLDEVDKLFEAAQGYRLAPLIRFAVYTGLRRGEMLGLKWEDVSWEPAAVTIRRQVTPVRGHPQVQDEPKTAAGEREVPLVAQAVEALKAQKAMLARDRLLGKPWHDEGWVFPSATGAVMHPSNVGRYFRAVVKRAKVEKRPFHALRHTAASILLGAGVPPELCAKIMGHKNFATFYNTYADLLRPAAQDAARKVEAFLAARSEETKAEKKTSPRRGVGRPARLKRAR